MKRTVIRRRFKPTTRYKTASLDAPWLAERLPTDAKEFEHLRRRVARKELIERIANAMLPGCLTLRLKAVDAMEDLFHVLLYTKAYRCYNPVYQRKEFWRAYRALISQPAVLYEVIRLHYDEEPEFLRRHGVIA